VPAHALKRPSRVKKFGASALWSIAVACMVGLVFGPASVARLVRRVFGPFLVVCVVALFGWLEWQQIFGPF
jgi:hypothetical protein